MPKTEMLVNYVGGEECRIAIVEDGKLEELYQERASAESHVGNIYKGKVTNVEPSIQAAFVDFGLERNGFLHISDLHPMYFPGDAREEFERVGLKTPRRERPPIQKCLRRGQDVLVQVIKEGIGNKGPTLTSYISIPGRFIVMMPHMEKLGVSRKIEDDDARRSMRNILAELDPPKGFGFILRTAGMDRTKAELKRDLAYLQRLWKAIEAQMKRVNIGELYSESDLVIRTIRDVLSSDLERIVVDDAAAAKRAHEFISIASPRSQFNVVHYKDPVPLFHRYGIEGQIETISSRQVPLPSGGSLVFDATEALVAVDVNSGKSRDARDAETNAYRTNMEAADEICRQLRLRDLGGVIVLDLIDMIAAKHRRAVEARFRLNLKKDRARTRTTSISSFGLLEMTRQRMRPSLKKSIYIDCAACRGAGQIKSNESVVLDVMRQLALVLHRKQVAKVDLIVSPSVAFQLLNHRRSQLVALEQKNGKSVMVRVKDSGPSDEVVITAHDDRGRPVDTDTLGPFEEPMFETVDAMSEIDDESYATAAARAPHSDIEAAEQEAQEAREGEAGEAADGEGEGAPRRKRRRRRGGRGRGRKSAEAANGEPQAGPSDDQAAPSQAADDPSREAAPMADEGAEQPAPTGAAADNGSTSEGGTDENGEAVRKRRRRRRGGRGRGRKTDAAGGEQLPDDTGTPEPTESSNVAASAAQRDAAPETDSRDDAAEEHAPQTEPVQPAASDASEPGEDEKPKPKRRRGKRSRSKAATVKAEGDAPEPDKADEDKPVRSRSRGSRSASKSEADDKAASTDKANDEPSAPTASQGYGNRMLNQADTETEPAAASDDAS